MSEKSIFLFCGLLAARIANQIAWAGGFFASMVVGACATEQSRPAQSFAPTIIAIGDLHGDYNAYEDLMREAGLIDRRGRWSGGDTIFVQIGDVPDRGPDTRKIIAHLMKLEKQAARAGGEVVALIGNHEAMNVTGDLRYVHTGEYEAFKTRSSKTLRDNYFQANKDSLVEYYLAKDPALDADGVRAAFNAEVPFGFLEHRRAWSPDGEIGAWVASHEAVRIIGDSLFVHGGISNVYAGITVDEINARVRAALNGNGDTAILEDEAGPLWYRGNGDESEEGALEITAALDSFGVTRIVIGHTPSLEGIKSVYGGRVMMIDTGIAKFYGGTRSYLRIDVDAVSGHSDGVVTDFNLETDSR